MTMKWLDKHTTCHKQQSVEQLNPQKHVALLRTNAIQQSFHENGKKPHWIQLDSIKMRRPFFPPLFTMLNCYCFLHIKLTKCIKHLYRFDCFFENTANFGLMGFVRGNLAQNTILILITPPSSRFQAKCGYSLNHNRKIPYLAREIPNFHRLEA